MLSGENSLGRVVSGRESITYQCAGMLSSPQVLSEVQSSCLFNSPYLDRQLSGSVSNKQTGIKQKPQAQPNASTPLAFVCPSSLDSNCQTHSRPSEFLGRFTVKESHNASGMDADNRCIPEGHSVLSPRHRSLCSPWQCTTPDLQLSLSSSSGNSGRCNVNRLELLGKTLHVSTNRPRTLLPSKAGKFHRNRGVRRSLPTVSGLVARLRYPLQGLRRKTRNFPASTGHKSLATRRNITTLSRLQSLTQMYTRQFSLLVATALTASHRASTTSQYRNCWKNFQSSLAKQQAGQVSKDTILQYVVHLNDVRHLNPRLS